MRSSSLLLIVLREEELVAIGKFLIVVGTGAGIIWLILLVITLLTTLQASTIIERYTPFGWIGLILSSGARIIAK